MRDEVLHLLYSKLVPALVVTECPMKLVPAFISGSNVVSMSQLFSEPWRSLNPPSCLIVGLVHVCESA